MTTTSQQIDSIIIRPPHDALLRLAKAALGSELPSPLVLSPFVVRTAESWIAFLDGRQAHEADLTTPDDTDGPIILSFLQVYRRALTRPGAACQLNEWQERQIRLAADAFRDVGLTMANYTLSTDPTIAANQLWKSTRALRTLGNEVSRRLDEDLLQKEHGHLAAHKFTAMTLFDPADHNPKFSAALTKATAMPMYTKNHDGRGRGYDGRGRDGRGRGYDGRGRGRDGRGGRGRTFGFKRGRSYDEQKHEGVKEEEEKEK